MLHGEDNFLVLCVLTLGFVNGAVAAFHLARVFRRESSVLTHASKLQGKLMLVHGLIDENVHFRHTARLINALIAARKPYDLLIFPDERHSPRKLQVAYIGSRAFILHPYQRGESQPLDSVSRVRPR